MIMDDTNNEQIEVSTNKNKSIPKHNGPIDAKHNGAKLNFTPQTISGSD